MQTPVGRSDPVDNSPGQTSQPEDIPGESKGIGKRVLGAVEGGIQSFAPISSVHQHVCAFHTYSHDRTRQVHAHHFCCCHNEEFRQCIIYDSDRKDARLIGIEYIISRKLFEGLPEDEKKYWHSHRYEVMSGELVPPRIPEPAERPEMKSLVDTYGKTWHTWQIDRGDTLPLGPPQLMMAITDDGQIDEEALNKRDEQYGIDSSDRRTRRHEYITPPETIAEGADHWQGGTAYQTTMEPVECKGME